MESKEIVDAILESMRAEVTRFVEQQSQISSSTEYEERILELLPKFCGGLNREISGKKPKSRNSKKSVDQLRSLGIKKRS